MSVSIETLLAFELSTTEKPHYRKHSFFIELRYLKYLRNEGFVAVDPSPLS